MKHPIRTAYSAVISTTTLLLGLILASAFAITACTSTSSNELSETNTLTILADENNVNNPYIQRIFELYEEKTGNDLNIVTATDTNYQAAAKESVNSGNPPDIVMTFNNNLMTDLGGTNQFVDLSDQPWTSDLVEGAREYISDQDGKLLGLPFWESSVSGTYFNKTILNDLGLRPATTQEEFDQLCAALASAGYLPISIGNDGGYGVYQFGLDPIVADNPEILEQLNNGTLKYSDIPEVRSMVTWLKNAYDAGWFGNTNTLTYEEWSPTLANGDAVMLFVWDTWFDTDFVDGKYTRDDFGLMPVFVGTTDTGTYEGGNLNMFAVNRASDKQELALEFLEFCATPENYNIAFDGIATEPVFKGQTTNVVSPMVLETRASIDELERASTAEPKIKGYDARAINEAIHKLYNDELTVDEVLAQMDATLPTSS